MTTFNLAGSLGLVAKLWPSSTFAMSEVRGPTPLRLGLRTNETGDRGWRSSFIQRCLTRTGVDTVIDSKLHEEQLLALFLRSRYRAQYICYISIGPFRLAIGLGMIGH